MREKDTFVWVEKVLTSVAQSKRSATATVQKETPLMAQYKRMKAKYPDALLLFRVGDFYETFGSDAISASRILGIVLTKRGSGSASEVELAGFPYHALDTYLPKLVRAGLRVAICDQLEDPKLAKKLVKRGVTELVTPGVTLDANILDQKRNNYLAAVGMLPGKLGLALLDVSTGEFLVAEGDDGHIRRLLNAYAPSEVVFARQDEERFKNSFGSAFYTFPVDDWVFALEFAQEKLTEQFGTRSLAGFGMDSMTAATVAAGAILYYLSVTEHTNCAHITRIRRLVRDEHVLLDAFTIRNLELIEPQQPGGMSLIQVLDKTVSPMGARMLRQWVLFPLSKKEEIERRLDAVTHFFGDEAIRELFIRQIRQIGDLERLTSRVSVKKAGPREVMHILKSLDAMDPLIRHCTNCNVTSLRELGAMLSPCPELAGRIRHTLVAEPAAQLGKGESITAGLSDELDELRDLMLHSKERLAEMQQREALKTGITSLKVGYNNVFGYFLEVTHTHKAKVPADWIRKQTLTNAERYVTEELKHYEEKILGAEERIAQIESALFDELLTYVSGFCEVLQRNARIIAEMDCYVSLAAVAVRGNYCRPDITDQIILDVKDGRHSVIEKQLPYGEAYVPNDLFLDHDTQQILIITGPNMAGKSAYLRQSALIVLMAQMGSYVPAREARVGLVDRLFSRVGASDNISSGESTFMVEMTETAVILNSLSARSLILMDEIGRGTSTYDGISIAWSIAEFLHGSEARPRTLFATHYHELTDLAEKLPRVRNYHVATREVGKKVIFLRKVEPGESLHSFGIHVAAMAGVPRQVVERADAVLHQLEKKGASAQATQALRQMPETIQMSIFETDSPETRKVIEEMKSTDLNGLTPIEALMKLSEWQGRVR